MTDQWPSKKACLTADPKEFRVIKGNNVKRGVYGLLLPSKAVAGSLNCSMFRLPRKLDQWNALWSDQFKWTDVEECNGRMELKGQLITIHCLNRWIMFFGILSPSGNNCNLQELQGGQHESLHYRVQAVCANETSSEGQQQQMTWDSSIEVSICTEGI